MFNAKKPAQNVSGHSSASGDHCQHERAQLLPMNSPPENREQYHSTNGESPERDVFRHETIISDEHIHYHSTSSPKKACGTGRDEGHDGL
jgi:hypothetical protein